MMIRDKIIRCARLALLIVFSILLGCAGMAEAVEPVEEKIELVELLSIIANSNSNSISILDILGGTQVEVLQADATVQAIKRTKRDEKLLNNSAAITGLEEKQRTDEHNDLIAKVKESVGLLGVKGKILNKYSGEIVQTKKFSNPKDPEGLAVRFAPSDEDLGIQ